MCGPGGVDISVSTKGAEPFSRGNYDTAEKSVLAEEDKKIADKAEGVGILSLDPRKVKPPAMRTLMA